MPEPRWIGSSALGAAAAPGLGSKFEASSVATLNPPATSSNIIKPQLLPWVQGKKRWMVEEAKFVEPLVWILVLHWRGIDLTRACVESVQKLTYQNCKVLVVDNGSDNQDGEKLKAEYPEISLLRLSENFGFAGGCNRGMEFCLENGAEYIWLVNNDAKVAEGSLSKLVDQAQQKSDVGALGGSVVDSLVAAVKHVEASRGTINFRSAKTKVTAAQVTQPTYADWLHGSNLLLRAKTLREVGLFDERYFLYFEDTELCHRINLKGWKCLFVPDAQIEHLGSASTQDSRKHWRSYYYIRNRFLFFGTYLPGVNGLPATLSMLSHVARHALVLPFRGEQARNQLRAELLGTRDYFGKRFGKATCLQWCEPGSEPKESV
jgi:GT2 family glycosyltransferase